MSSRTRIRKQTAVSKLEKKNIKEKIIALTRLKSRDGVISQVNTNTANITLLNMTSSIKWLCITRLQKAKNILETTRDTLNTTTTVRDNDQEAYSRSAFGALPSVWLRAL